VSYPRDRDIRDALFEIDHWYLNDKFLAKECIIITSREEHRFAEHLFLEKKHAMFLNQCYALWNKCLRLENRIQKLEEFIHNKIE
jgi:hypothetical protein